VQNKTKVSFPRKPFVQLLLGMQCITAKAHVTTLNTGGSPAWLRNKSKVDPRASWRRDNTFCLPSQRLGKERTDSHSSTENFYKLFSSFLLNPQGDNSWFAQLPFGKLV